MHLQTARICWSITTVVRVDDGFFVLMQDKSRIFNWQPRVIGQQLTETRVPSFQPAMYSVEWFRVLGLGFRVLGLGYTQVHGISMKIKTRRKRHAAEAV